MIFFNNYLLVFYKYSIIISKFGLDLKIVIKNVCIV